MSACALAIGAYFAGRAAGRADGDAAGARVGDRAGASTANVAAGEPKFELPPALPDDLTKELPKLRAEGEQRGGPLTVIVGRNIPRSGKLDAPDTEIELSFLQEVIVEAQTQGSGSAGSADDKPPLRCHQIKGTATGWAAPDHMWCELWRKHSPVKARCSLRTIWELAILEGAPPDGRAFVMLYDNDWHFMIGEHPNPKFSGVYPDLCR